MVKATGVQVWAVATSFSSPAERVVGSELSRRSREAPRGQSPATPRRRAPADDDPYEAGLKVFGSKPDHGSVCSGRCFAKGVGCVPLAVHPYKPEGGIGKLFACNDLYIGFMCGYHYPNGDDCHYLFGMPFPKTCTYSGND